MVRGSLACGVSPRQDLRPHSPNTGNCCTVIGNSYFCTVTRNHGNFQFFTWSEVLLHVACLHARVCVHIHRTHAPSIDVFSDILIFCRRALADFGITHHDDQNPELSPASSTCQSTEQTTSGKATELLSWEPLPPSSRAKTKANTRQRKTEK